MLLIAGSSCRVLGIKVARELNTSLFSLETKKFPDGELYVRINEDVSGRNVAVLQSMYLWPNDFLMEYLLVADTLKDLGAQSILAILPYFAYARQDQRFKSGEAVSFKTVANLIRLVGTSQIYTIDTHLHRIHGLSEIFKIPTHELTAVPLLSNYIKENFELNRPIVIGPDEEAEQWAKIAAGVLGCDHDVFEKRRLGPREVEVTPRRGNVADRDIVVIDDIISTGGTIVETLAVLKKLGARRVIVACVHPLLVEQALARIYEAGAYAVVGTDTVVGPASLVTVAPIIAEALRSAFAD
jgi:ribose-phosphate pyrophosphokinase